MNESARYRIDYGVLSIGEIRLTIDGGARGASVVRAGGYGEGAILGLGRMQNRVDAEFDPQRLDSRRWTNARKNGDIAIRDLADQAKQGQIDLVRERSGAAVERQQALVMGPALDPVGFLLRLRVSPPGASGPPQVLYVLDGQALWRVTITNRGREPLPDSVIRAPALRLQAQADPIHYDGSADPNGDRSQRLFTLWLADDPSRVPLRLEMPIGIADLVVALVALDRQAPRPAPGARSLYPTWRTVSIIALPGPSFARRRRTWMSTVRVPPAYR
jgi:hypothetical protein